MFPIMIATTIEKMTNIVITTDRMRIEISLEICFLLFLITVCSFAFFFHYIPMQTKNNEFIENNYE